MIENNVVETNFRTEIVRRRARTISLRVTPSGTVRVLASLTATNKQIQSFIIDKEDWLTTQINRQNETYSVMRDGQIAPGLKVVTISGNKLSAKLASKGVIEVVRPDDCTDFEAYMAARKLIKKEMLKSAKTTLPRRLSELAAQSNISKPSISIKYLRTRWGSCSSNVRINLNSQLLRLPSELIDYVIYHELAHLDQPNHSRKFHQRLSSLLPDAKQRQKELKSFRLMY